MVPNNFIEQIKKAISEVEKFRNKQVVVFGSQFAIAKFVPLEYIQNNKKFYYLGVEWYIVPNDYLEDLNKLYIIPQEDFNVKIRYVEEPYADFKNNSNSDQD